MRGDAAAIPTSCRAVATCAVDELANGSAGKPLRRVAREHSHNDCAGSLESRRVPPYARVMCRALPAVLVACPFPRTPPRSPQPMQPATPQPAVTSVPPNAADVEPFALRALCKSPKHEVAGGCPLDFVVNATNSEESVPYR